jgi:FkbM family methyltransferase
MEQIIATRDEILKRYLDVSNPDIFDVGANLGQTVAQMLTLYPDAEIYCFEPSPETFEALAGQFGLHANIHCHDIALSDETGTRLLYSNTFSQSDSFYQLNEKGLYGSNGVKTIASHEVKCDTLDSFCAHHTIDKINFLKIDTQGHSYQVVKGAVALLAQQAIDVIQLEVILGGNCYEQKDNLGAIETLLTQHEYELFTLVNTDNHQIGNFYFRYTTGQIAYIDLIYMPRDSINAITM